MRRQYCEPMIDRTWSQPPPARPDQLRAQRRLEWIVQRDAQLERFHRDRERRLVASETELVYAAYRRQLARIN